MNNRPALQPIASRWEWQDSAACRGTDVSSFYSPARERGRAKEARERRARQVCSGCPVRVECAKFALAIGERFGVWGGMTDQERRAVLKSGVDAIGPASASAPGER